MSINKSMVNKTAIFVLTAIFIFSGVSFSQGRNDKIKEIRIKNNKAISEAIIISKIKTRPGDVFSQDIVNDDLKRLYALGYFTDVSIDFAQDDEGIVLSIIVEEKPIVEEVVFEGNKKISTRRLKKAIQTKPEEMLNYSKLAQDIKELKDLYNQQGFQQVEIKYEIETDKDTNTAMVYILVDEKTRVRIKKVYVDGNESVSDRAILNMMKTRPAWIFNRGYFDDEDLSADMEKIKMYYQNMGYLDVNIEPEFALTDDQKLMFITLKINEGKRYVTGKITISGNLVFPEEDMLRNVTMKEDAPFSYARLRMDMDEIRGFYFQKGYMNVDINADRKIGPATNKIDIHYTVNANEVVYVGKIDIKGNEKTKDIVIRRELRIYPGERFDGDKIRRSKERLYNLGFFEDVYFNTETTTDPQVNNLIVSVKETKTGEFAFGGGYSSVDQFIGFVQITQKNFDLFNFPYFTGDGQFLSLRANIGNIRWDYELSWTEPWIFDYPLSFGFDAYNRTHSRTSDTGYGYQETRSGGDVRFGKEFGEYFRTDLIYKLEDVNISDLSDDATQDLVSERGENWISSLMLGLTFDTRDNIYSPTRGFVSRLILENAGGFLGFDKDFLKSFFSTSFYHTIFSKIVIEVKGSAGLADSYGDTDEVPIYERFYAGGADTIRGYKERRVGPRDPGSSSPIGGEAIILGNAEITFPIYERVIKGAIFYDVGNVWRHVEDYFSDGVKSGIGAGIRVKTPIGPLKLDMGYPLSDNQNDKKQIEWYFSVSHGF